MNGTSTDARAVRARADALGLPDDEFRDDRDAAIVWSTLVEPGDRVAGAALAAAAGFSLHVHDARRCRLQQQLTTRRGLDDAPAARDDRVRRVHREGSPQRA